MKTTVVWPNIESANATTVAIPAVVLEVRVAVATPPTVVLVVGAIVPRVVAKVTIVPSATG